MNKLIYSLIGIALVLGAVIGYAVHGGNSSFSAGSATDCADNTCLTSLYVTPGTLAVAGATTFASTLGVTGTSTLAQSIVMTESTACIQFNATSSNTKTKITFEVGSTTPTATAGLLGFAYGTCN